MACRRSSSSSSGTRLPSGRASSKALRWPETTDPCQVRIIEVPPELHRRFRHSENLPLFQMIAKNVGIRRARGRFVLATNIDILLSDELVRALARGELAARAHVPDRPP